VTDINHGAANLAAPDDPGAVARHYGRVLGIEPCHPDPGHVGHIGQRGPCGPDCEDCARAAAAALPVDLDKCAICKARPRQVGASYPACLICEECEDWTVVRADPAAPVVCCESRDDCDGPTCQCPCHDAATGGA
jgi:hypothetical protein